MKALIICQSFHHGNTKKIAEALAQTLGARIVNPGEVNDAMLYDHDLIGFGSGIYFSKHHISLFELLDKLPQQQHKKAFIFSTRGAPLFLPFHRPLKKELIKKGFDVIGEFSCKAYDTYGLLRYIGGINRNKPNIRDMNNAKEFAASLKI